ncbi:hypothetical protein BMT54_06385 [Pasteurellaceae bacterium 15-036681]|nr:hypothetical protein BMT54_06385 [Pasteurellaceae bacterium 15-036681]
MEEYQKDELFFLILTSIQCTLPFVAGWLIRNYFVDMTYQRIVVGICVLSLGWIYIYAHKHFKKPIGNQYYIYLLLSIVASLSLGGFSQEELSQFGFNFSADPKEASMEYLQLKMMFNAITVCCLPAVLQRTFGIKPS